MTSGQLQRVGGHLPDGIDELSDLVTPSALRPDNDSEIAHVIREAIGAVGDAIADASEVAVVVLNARVVAAEPVTLAEIGRRVGLTGERIRGIESKLRSQIDDAVGPFIQQVIVPLKEWLGDFVNDDQFHSAVAAVAGGSDNLASRIIARQLKMELRYQENHGIWISPRVVDAASQLVIKARGFSDDFGCIDEARLRQTELGQRWSDTWNELLSVAGLERICGILVLASTRQVQVAAALRAIGRSATKAEIEDQLKSEIDGKMFRVDAVLASLDGVVRASKTTWGFEEWVDDVYEGIPAEILQRINEDGGSTRLSRLLDEIPRLFGVRESSVWAYLQTPAFRVEHGWVSEANSYSGPVGTLEDVADGFTDADDPFWTFSVESRFLRGYSLPSVPPEVSIALGVDFGEKSTASVRFPVGCSDVSVIWRPTAMHGPEIGRLASALEALQVKGGERVNLVIHGTGEVSFKKLKTNSPGTDPGGSRHQSSAESLRPDTKRQSGVRTRPPLRARLSAPERSG